MSGYFCSRRSQGNCSISENHAAWNPMGFQATLAASMPEQTEPNLIMPLLHEIHFVETKLASEERGHVFGKSFSPLDENDSSVVITPVKPPTRTAGRVRRWQGSRRWRQ